MRFVCALLAALAVGCDSGADPRLRPDGAVPLDTPTYYADVAPLVRRECLGCHVEGGIAPFALDSYEALAQRIDVVVTAVESGFMPPWMPDPECRHFEYERHLSDDERAVFRRWRDGRLPRGAIEDLPPAPEGPAPFVPTHVARMPEPYTPDPTRPDDYRCFVLDATFERDAFLTGRNVVPGAASIVHHVLVYAVREELLTQVEQADAAAPGPGYPCFAGPLPTNGSTTDTSSLSLIGLGGWVPGQLPFRERPGRAAYIPRGSRLVMQVHYNTLEEDPQPDDTIYQMEQTETPPEYLVTTKPLAIRTLNIAPGDPSSTHRQVFRNYGSEPLTVTAVTPHMHLLGTRIGAQHVPSAGARACMIDVPRWNFGWQQSYRFREGETVELATGDGVELTCIYDNSASHQPVINGEQAEPRQVGWGEGTLDEMCLMYLQHEVPWTGPPETGCAAAAGCLERCASGDTECLLSCEGFDGGCRACVLRATLGCARDTCLASYAPAATCIQSCILQYVMLGGSFDRCMRSECGSAYPAALACTSNVVDAGTCDAALTGCGIAR